MNPLPNELRWFTGVVLAAVCVAAGVTLRVDNPPPLEAIVVFGALVIFSAAQPVHLPNGVDLSPAFMVCMAAIVVFGHEAALAGALLIGALSGVRVGMCNRVQWGWVLFNFSVAGLSFLAAGAAYRAATGGGTDSLPVTLLGTALATAAYLVTISVLLGASYTLDQQRPWRDTLAELAPMAVQVLPFSLLGFLLGRLYLEHGAAVLVLVVVPVLIAREMFASYLKVKEAHDETVQMLIRALETKDRYTAGHSGRVATYARYMGEEFMFGPSRMERLRFAALMHDIGKLVVPNHILNKPGKLTEEEFARVRLHERVSVQMLSNIDFLRPIAAATHSDAMRFDPDDEDHPVEPYIIMVADAYDAMTSTRSYRKALTQEVAFKELRDKSGTQFHPECVEALIAAIEKRGERHGRGHETEAAFADAPEAGVGSAGLGDLVDREGVKP